MQAQDAKVTTEDCLMQTDDIVIETFTATVQTDEIKKSVLSVKTQTIKVNSKSRGVDTSGLPSEVKPEEKEIKVTVSSPKEASTVDGSPMNVKIKKPNLYLDSLSSPPDSGTNSENSKRRNEFDMSSTPSNKTSLSYMLNRDPLKEFFHLTLQSIKMNSPHMNQILSINADMFYKKAMDDSIPFNQWGTWLEDQLNRIVLSKILKLNLQNKMSAKAEESKIEAKVGQMDSLEVAKLIKKAPITSKASGGMKGLFSFGFMKKAKKAQQELEKPKPKTEFDEILEKPMNMPKTSRNATKKHFEFDLGAKKD